MRRHHWSEQGAIAVQVLTDVLPESARPYAKAIYALIIGVVGLLVSLLVIDDATGVKITQAVTALAVLLGVLEIPNQETPDIPAEPAGEGSSL
jgi:TRAP-type C4-dicarboxylate transport system permease small subunit